VYVCICNAVTETDVHRCVASGACTTKQVKQACDWKPGCGSCTGRLITAVRQANAALFDDAPTPAALTSAVAADSREAASPAA
jgi:bacterioferritin-associated ferredoxin